MNVSPYYEHAMRQTSEEDIANYNLWTGFLPKREETTPYHSGPHSIRVFRAAFQLAKQPKRILEIGFCLGHSATIMLELGAETVDSMDISDRPQTIEAAIRMVDKYEDRFSFQKYSSESMASENRLPEIYSSRSPSHDLAFIDGGHDYKSVCNDVSLVMHLKVPFILFDDYFTHWSDGVQPAIERFRLIPIAIIGSMALCVREL